jgi:hypothetical protein
MAPRVPYRRYRMGRSGATSKTRAANAPVRRTSGCALAIDFDSTAWPLLTAMGSHPETPLLNGEPIGPHNTPHWDTPLEMYGGDVQAMLAGMDKCRTLEMFRQVGMFPGFVEAVRELQQRGYRPTILTDNSELACSNIAAYLRELGLEIEVVRKSAKEKVAWCIEQGSPVLVDDSPTAIETAAGQVQLLTFPYLYNAAAVKAHGAIVCGDWDEMLEKIIQICE